MFNISDDFMPVLDFEVRIFDPVAQRTSFEWQIFLFTEKNILKGVLLASREV